MKILIAGNHTCGNRGDAAILRGLVEEIERRRPDAELTITSRYPQSSGVLLGRDFVMDAPFEWRKREKRWGRLQRAAVPRVMRLMMQLPLTTGVLPLPAAFREEIKRVAQYDAVFMVGGSFFVDLYGLQQFDYPWIALHARRPLVLLGHSLGPFAEGAVRTQMRSLLRYAKCVYVREPESLKVLQESRLPLEKVSAGADTAWLVSTTNLGVVRCVSVSLSGRPRVAITARELAPFDKRLNITQQDYVQAFAALCNSLIDHGFDIIAASTCTSIGGYHKDDRLVSQSIKQQVKKPEHFHVVMDELTDVELGSLFSSCVLVIGTRLHSAIIAMNFGTPAVALNYEHKSAGIMEQAGLPGYAHPVTSLLNGKLQIAVFSILESIAGARTEVEKAVTSERQRAKLMVGAALEGL